MDKTAAQAELLINRLVKRHRHLKKWARRTGTNAYRLYDRDIPEIPLVLDLYDDAVSGALYKRPYEKDEGEEEAWLGAMREAAAQALEIPQQHIFLKERQRMRNRQETGKQYGKFSGAAFYRDVREGDLLFRVNLSGYLDTGLFLDARKKRALIRKEAPGKRVLNLFSYTCSLSVAAAKGSAARVDSVDLSKTYLDWGKVNFALNGIKEQSEFEFIHADVIRFVKEAAIRKTRWDIIILDSPGFSNSKRMQSSLDLRRDHRELIRRCLLLLSPGGKLWFSSSAKGLELAADDFPGYIINDMGKDLEDEDFRGKRMPLCRTFTGSHLCGTLTHK